MSGTAAIALDLLNFAKLCTTQPSLERSQTDCTIFP